MGPSGLRLGPGRAGLDYEALAAARAVCIGVGVSIILGEAGLVYLLFGVVGVKNSWRDEGSSVLREGRFKLGATSRLGMQGLGNVFDD